MASFLPVCTTVDAAVASYTEHGGAVIRMPSLSPEYDAALNELYQWCDECDGWMMCHPSAAWDCITGLMFLEKLVLGCL